MYFLHLSDYDEFCPYPGGGEEEASASTESCGSGGDTGGGGEMATVLLPLTYQAGDLLHYHMYVLPTGLIVPTPSHVIWD